MAEQVHLVGKSKKLHKPLLISLKDHDILTAVLEHRGLTVEQVTKLFYKSGSLTYVRVKLMELSAQKYLSRFHFPTVSTGASPFVYTLGTRGIRYLSESGIDLKRWKPLTTPSYLFLKHLLAVNDFMIHAQVLSRLTADVALKSIVHEWRLKPTPVTATSGTKTVSAVADILCDFTVVAANSRMRYQMPIWVEIDRDTEWGKKFQDKLADLVFLLTEGAYQQHFGFEHITYAFATTKSKTRRDRVRAHLKDVLQRMGKLRFADLFLTAFVPQEADPHTIFLSPLWYTPDNPTPLPLLDMSD